MLYRRIAKFRLHGNEYVMFLDDHNKKFFLKYLDNKYYYVKISELIDIYKTLECQVNADVLCSEKKKIEPKVIAGGALVLLTIACAGTVWKVYEKYNPKDAMSGKVSFEDYVSTTDKPSVYQERTDFLLNSIDDNIFKKMDEYHENGVDYYHESDTYNYLYVFDSEYVNKALGDYMPTKEDLIDAVNKNDNIEYKYKILLYDYINRLCNNYSDVDLRIFYKNLKTIKIEERSESEIEKIASSNRAYACYVISENIVYLPMNKTYEFNSIDYITFCHELSHALRNYKNVDKETGKETVIQFNDSVYNNELIEEALNNLFAESLVGDEHAILSYQLPSNIVNVMIECMDNYSLSDYVNHSSTYFVDKLNKYNDSDDAIRILELISLQYEDYYDQTIDLDYEEYKPIYKYVANMYYKKYIKDGMSYEDAKWVEIDLASKIYANLPGWYNTSMEPLDEALDEYYYSYINNDENTKTY